MARAPHTKLKMSIYKWSPETHWRFYPSQKRYVAFLVWVAKQIHQKDVWVHYVIPTMIEPCLLPDFCISGFPHKYRYLQLFDPHIMDTLKIESEGEDDGENITTSAAFVPKTGSIVLQLISQQRGMNLYGKRYKIVLNDYSCFLEFNEADFTDEYIIWARFAGKCPIRRRIKT